MRTILLIFLAFSSLAYAADTMTVDGIHKEHRPITVNHDPTDVIAVLFWKDGMAMQLGEDHFDREVEGRTVFVAPPGIYIVTIRGSQIITVTPDNDKVLPDPPPKPKPDPIPSPGPTPGPNPSPSPDPIPGPPDGSKIKVERVFFIEEQNDRNVNPQYIAFTNFDFQKKLKDKGVKVYTFDDDDPDANVQSWVRLLSGKMPAAVFYSDASNYRIEALPKDITADSLYSLYEKVAK